MNIIDKSCFRMAVNIAPSTYNKIQKYIRDGELQLTSGAIKVRVLFEVLYPTASVWSIFSEYSKMAES